MAISPKPTSSPQMHLLAIWLARTRLPVATRAFQVLNLWSTTKRVEPLG